MSRRAASASLALLGALLAAFGACEADDEPEGSGATGGSGGAGNAAASAGGGVGGSGDAGGSGATAGVGDKDSGRGAGGGGWPDDAGLPPEHAWLADPKIWTAVPGTEFTQPDCAVYEAAPGLVGFPPLAWQACGAACQAADVVQGYGDKAIFGVGSTHAMSGGALPFLVVEHRVTSEFLHLVRRLVRLSDGASLGAIQGVRPINAVSAGCVFGNGRESARANVLVGGMPSREMNMLAPLDGKSWTWSQPAKIKSEMPVGLVQFDIDTPGGAIFEVGKGGVYVLVQASVNDWTPLEVPSQSRHGAGEGDLAVWTDYPSVGGERVRGWAPDGKGVRTIIAQAPYETCSVATAPTALVGFTMEGPDGCASLTGAPAVRMWKSPRVYDVTGSSVSVGPLVPGGPYVGGSHLRAWGDFAATLLAEVDGGVPKSFLFMVMQLSTSKLWRVEPRAGHILHTDAWTLTESHLYFGEKLPSDDAWTTRWMVRVELGQLDLVGKALN